MINYDVTIYICLSLSTLMFLEAVKVDCYKYRIKNVECFSKCQYAVSQGSITSRAS